MSRIQQIMNKAEREGVIRRTHAPVNERAAVALEDAPRRNAAAPAAWPAIAAPVARHAEPEPIRRAAEPRVIEAGALSPLIVAATNPQAAVAEQYRSLRTRLALSEAGQSRRVLIVSSPAKGDGKSITAANLAFTMAQDHWNSRRVGATPSRRRYGSAIGRMASGGYSKGKSR
jgi:hypothetical protein